VEGAAGVDDKLLVGGGCEVEAGSGPTTRGKPAEGRKRIASGPAVDAGAEELRAAVDIVVKDVGPALALDDPVETAVADTVLCVVANTVEVKVSVIIMSCCTRAISARRSHGAQLARSGRAERATGMG